MRHRKSQYGQVRKEDYRFFSGVTMSIEKVQKEKDYVIFTLSLASALVGARKQRKGEGNDSVFVLIMPRTSGEDTTRDSKLAEQIT